MTCRLRRYGQTRNQMYNSNITDIWSNFMSCHPRATCHIAGCSHLAKSIWWSCHVAGCNNSIRHIENCFSPYFFVFKYSLVFDERQLTYRLRYTCFVEANYWRTQSIARPLCNSRATCLEQAQRRRHAYKVGTMVGMAKQVIEAPQASAVWRRRSKLVIQSNFLWFHFFVI